MSGFLISSAGGGGPFLPLSGGTMTGAIVLANVAGTITMPSPGASATLISSNATGSTASGAWTFSTGTTASAASGGFSFTTGNVSTAGASGGFTVTTGTGTGSASGAISFTTGASNSGTGAISFTVGTPTGGTRGSITGDALDYTFTSRAASGANSFVFRANSTYSGAGLLRIQDGSGAGTSGDRIHVFSDVSNVTVVNILTGNGGNGLQIRSGNAPIIQPNAAGAAADLTIQSVNNAGDAGGIIFNVGSATAAGQGGEFDVNAGAGFGTGNGGAVTIDAGAGGATSGTGGALTGTSGAAGGTGGGGGITWTTGVGGSSATGGGAYAIVTGNGGTGTGDGGAYTVTTGNGSTTGTGGRGGNITITTGNGGGSTARQSGSYSVTTGTPSATGTSGGLTFQTGVGGSTSGASGGVTIQTGTTTSGTTGTISLVVGTPTSGTTGDFSVSGARNFTLTGGGVPVLTVINDDAGAGGGPDIVLYRNSASAAANDVLGRLIFDGNSATPTRRTMGIFQSVLITATNGAEDSQFEWNTILAGASNPAMRLLAAGALEVDANSALGAATVGLFDDHDDALVLRTALHPDFSTRQRGLGKLLELGVLTPKSNGLMFNVLEGWKLVAGGVYQTAERVAVLESENRTLRARINALEAR